MFQPVSMHGMVQGLAHSTLSNLFCAVGICLTGQWGRIFALGFVGTQWIVQYISLIFILVITDVILAKYILSRSIYNDLGKFNQSYQIQLTVPRFQSM